jgi:uncharacterized protein (TIGR00725 family)
MSKMTIGILGGRKVNCSNEALQFAEAVGIEIGKRGWALVCGGEDGIMEAACRGCKQAEGVTIGIMKWNHAQDANDYVDYAICTSMDLARANIIIWTAAGLIAFEGRYGTATEIGLAFDVGRPIVITGENSLFSLEAFNAENCVRIPGNDVSNASLVVNKLEELISKSDLLKDARNN